MASIPQEFSCDECGKRRTNDANHWFVVFHPGTVDLGDARGRVGKGLAVFHWDEDIASLANPLHVCGLECLLKKISGILNEPKGAKNEDQK